jgi:hypothetical protein
MAEEERGLNLTVREPCLTLFSYQSVAKESQN